MSSSTTTMTMTSATAVAAAIRRSSGGDGRKGAHRQLSCSGDGRAAGGSASRGAGAVALRRSVVAPRGRRDRGGAVGVYAARWLLKNSGPKTTDHLGEDVMRIPGDLELAAPRMVVGRQASDSVCLEVPVPTVSGAHAMIEVAPDKVMVTDLSSTNGTFIEGEELKAGLAYELAEGGEVIFGDEYLACYELLKVE